MKLKHHRTTIVLVAAAAVLTAVMFWDRGNVSTGEADKRTENIIEAWRVDDVTKIEMTVGDRSMTMVRETDDEGQQEWVLYEGEERLDGDPLEMTELASTLELAMFYRKVDDIDDAQLGLASPRAKFVVHMGKLTYTIAVGAETPQPKDGAYLEVDGGSRGRVVYVVTGPTKEEFLINPTDLMTKQLSKLTSNAVQRYEVAQGDETYELVRGGWGGWTTGAFLLKREGQPNVRADRQKVDQLVREIGRIDAKRFVPVRTEDPEGAIAINIYPRDTADLRVRLLVALDATAGCDPATEAYALRREPNPQAGCIPKRVLEHLRIAGNELVDRRVVGTEKGAITEIKLETGGSVVDLARKGDGWILREPTEAPAEKEPTEQLISGLVKATGERVADPDLEALGLQPPRATVRILGLPERTAEGGETDRVEKLTIGDEIDGTIHIRREDDGAVLAVDAAAASLFLAQPTLLRPTQIFSEERKYIRGIEADCAGRTQKIARGLDVTWEFEAPKNAEAGVDGALATDLMDGMRELQAVRWEAEKASERHQLGKPWCTIRVNLVEPDPADATGDTKIRRTLAVLLGAETQGGYYARVQDDEAVFVAPRTLASAARVWLLSRAAVHPNLADVDTITLRAGDKTFVARRQGESWKADGGADSLALTVRNTLQGLNAEVVEHRGPPREASGFSTPVLTVELSLRNQPDGALTFQVGRADQWRNTAVFRVRRSDLDLTFLVAKSRIQPLLDAL